METEPARRPDDDDSPPRHDEESSHHARAPLGTEMSSLLSEKGGNQLYVTRRRHRHMVLFLLSVAVACGLLSFRRVASDANRENGEMNNGAFAASKTVPWYAPGGGLVHNESRCQRTQILPFRVACPATCSDRRSDLDPDRGEPPLYAMQIVWNLGEQDLYVEGVDMNEQPAFFYATAPVIESFLSASKDVEEMATNDHDTSNLTVAHQAFMHVTLSYFCCLTRREAGRLREIVKAWIKGREFNFTVRIDHLQCWRERRNSITNILVLDDESQDVLTELNHEIRDVLREYGVPVVVEREEQMPFHATLVGLYSGEEESLSPNDDLDSIEDSVYRIVRNVSDAYRDRWMGNSTTGAERLRIHFDPSVYDDSVPFVHNY